MIAWASAVIRLAWDSSDIAATISRNSTLTSYMYVQVTVMCVCYTINLLCFSTTVLLRFAAVWWPLETVSIAPVINNTLALSTPKDSSSLLYGRKQSYSKCLLYTPTCLVLFLLDLLTSFLALDFQKGHIDAAHLCKLKYSQLSSVAV